MRQRKRETVHLSGRAAFPQKEGDMNPAISPTAGAAGIESVKPADATAAAQRSERAPSAASAVSLQTVPSSPPPEVLAEMAHAGEIYDRLSAQGRTLHFAYDASSRRTAVEVRDRKGAVVGQLSLAQALDVAAGAPLE
jgi:YD repeat-containing protein